MEGIVTIDNVVAMTQRGMSLFDEHHRVIDLGKVTEVDSTIISMLLEWLRAARQKNCHLQFMNMPASLVSLIQLYDLVKLIPVTTNPVTRQNASDSISTSTVAEI
ncbi:lipid asymmetry maintenance protein MlaB [Nitrosomonas sp. Nm166]|uniref:STAS domain-containing protein n=1 Tax=Nitrosomonas sp. Nm166 TaxID=1881054 RepID=UPI00210F1982|nr:STAS domain-containing protein [Nitrosomonas sp. Nm166]